LSLSIAYGAGATGWLSTSALSGGTVPATLTIRPVTTGLAAGSYSATVTVSGTNVASKTLTVALTVTAAGLAVTLAQWPALGTVGGVAGSVGTLNFAAVAIVRTGTNSYAAFSLRCPHEGIQVQVVNGQSFRCPGHGATFNADGSLMANSPLRTGPLSALKVTYNPGDAVLYVS
jgi:nitrite reductase/ring-hydroxylating ferredoxin subunit